MNQFPLARFRCWEPRQSIFHPNPKNPLVVFLSKRIPFLNAYDDRGSFFVKVPVDAAGNAVLPTPRVVGREELAERADAVEAKRTKKGELVPVYRAEWFEAALQAMRLRSNQEDVENNNNDAGEKKSPTPESSDSDAVVSPHAVLSPGRASAVVGAEWRCTMLFVVVLCLEVTDVLFAVDSVSAIVAQIQDLYLAYTACIFAMLGLRAMFFMVDELIRMFKYLKYGVAFMLVFIGVKLIVSKVVHIPPSLVCGVLIGTLFTCMTASIYFQEQKKGEVSEYGGSPDKKALAGRASGASSAGGATSFDGSPGKTARSAKGSVVSIPPVSSDNLLKQADAVSGYGATK